MRSMRSLYVAFLMMIAASAYGGETGSVSGVARSTDGSALPGVTVTITGPTLPATGHTTDTNADGSFNFERLQPGRYQLKAELAGMGGSSRDVVVAVDRDTHADLSLNPSLSETITVTAAVPVVDVKSTEVQTNFTSEMIAGLPLARSYKGLFQLAPGVAENGLSAPNAGGNRQDNKFLADGINLTNPHYGNLVPNITDLDIKEVNIKRAAVTAEFGSTAGMVINAVTKSGTNDFKGEARYVWQPDDLAADPKGSTGSLSNTDRAAPGISLGGPVLRDRVWFYGSASLPKDTTTNRSNNLGRIPDESVETDEYFLKFTAAPMSNHFFNLSGRSRNTDFTNQGIDNNELPTVASNDTTEYILATGGWTWNLTSRSLIDTKVNFMREENTTDPITKFGYHPTWDPANLDRMGYFTTSGGLGVGGATDAINNQNYHRDEYRLTFQTLQDWFGMSHDLRTGASYDRNGEDLERLSNGWGTITIRGNGQIRARSYTPQPQHQSLGKTIGVFVQDQATIGERTTLSLGLLVNKDEIIGGDGNTVVSFDWDQMIQPRLGVSFVVMPAVRDKVYANFGRYMSVDNKSLGRAGSRTRIFRTDYFFDPVSGVLLRTAPQSSTTTKVIDPGLDPMYTDEFVVGYARPIGSVWSAETFAIFRTFHDVIEDVSADGLGNGPFHVAQLPGANRKYRAYGLEANRVPANDAWMRLAVNASYTWSRLTGNWDLDYDDGGLFYSSSYLQDGPGLLITDNRQGKLTGDRTHVAKVFASVSPFARFRVGTYVRFQSGGAWEARGLEDEQSGLHLRYLEPAGTRRMDDWFNTDLLTSYEIPLAGLGLELEARIINIFDEQAQLGVDNRKYLDLDDEAADVVNPRFGETTSRSAPRSVILSAIIRY